jgi:ABC-type transport system involved in multi-copper enzyme maturation permease subunit
MVYWKIWSEVRKRFYICLGISTFIVLFLIMLFPLSSLFLNYIKENVTSEELILLQKYTGDYRLFMDEGWFHEIGFVALFAIVFSLGGIMTEVRSRSIFVTLSLPVSRRRWILSQSLISALLVLGITASACVLVLTGGLFLGRPYPLPYALGGTLLLTAGALPWIGITLWITSLTQDRLKAAVCTVALWFLTEPLKTFSSFAEWMPQSILNLLQPLPFPWQASLSLLILSSGTLLAAVKHFDRRDY